MATTKYKIDYQNGKKKYVDSLIEARKIAYAYFKRTKRTLPIVIYRPSGKLSGIVSIHPYGGADIIWKTITDKNGSMSVPLYADGKTGW